jgi:threonine dehydratase
MLLAGRLGDLTWPIVRDKVDDVITVTENEIVKAMCLAMERLKVVVEPSGAVGLAAVLAPQFRARHPTVDFASVILSGGNMDLESVGFSEAWMRKAHG